MKKCVQCRSSIEHMVPFIVCCGGTRTCPITSRHSNSDTVRAIHMTSYTCYGSFICPIIFIQWSGVKVNFTFCYGIFFVVRKQ